MEAALKPNNVVHSPSSDEVSDRPGWVPANARWANGMWYLNGLKLADPAAVPMPPEVLRAQHQEAARKRVAATTEGLPIGQYRHGGLIYDRQQKVVGSDDGSHRADYAKLRASRIARIQAAAVARQASIVTFEAAKLHMERMEAEFHKAYLAKED